MFHLLLWFVLEVVSTYSTVQKLCETRFMFYLANCECGKRALAPMMTKCSFKSF